MRLPAEAVILQVTTETGSDLAHFLANNLPGKQSIRQIKRGLEQGRCLVNGQAENFGSRRLRRYDVVAFVPIKNDRENWHRFDPKRVLHQDAELIAYDKPPLLPVTPTDSRRGQNLQQILRREFEGVTAAHRLDADTSGIVLLARSEEMRTYLYHAFEEHLVTKTYLAMVRGVPKDPGNRTSYLIKKAGGTGFERWGSGRGSGALQAITRWSVVERFGKVASLLKVQPETGRTHQIRIHLSEIGHPLLGDRVYGDRRDPVLVPRQLLHARELAVSLPDGKRLKLQAPIPEDFIKCSELLRRR